MPDDSIKYDYIRAQIEQRRLPMIRLQPRQGWLLIFAFVFIPLAFFIGALRGSEVYRLLMPLFWICFLFGIIAVIRYSLDFQRENALQEEIKREMELERLRLLHDLTYSNQGEQSGQKLKNRLSLSDDGELIANDALANNLSQKNGMRPPID